MRSRNYIARRGNGARRGPLSKLGVETSKKEYHKSGKESISINSRRTLTRVES